MKTYRDFTISSNADTSWLEIEDRLECDAYYQNLVNVAIYALLRSARQVERLTKEQWNPDTLTVSRSGIALYERLRAGKTMRMIDFSNIPEALEISQMFL